MLVDARRPPRTVVPGPTMAAGGDLPHDLYTFVIEDALGIEYGFWGCVAAGATFKTLGRKRTPQGKAVIADHADDLDAAEARVNEIYFAWRAGEPTPLDHRLDSMRVAMARIGRGRRTGPPVADPPARHPPPPRLPAFVAPRADTVGEDNGGDDGTRTHDLLDANQML